MPLFSDPLEPPSLRSAGRQLLRHGASLLALMGWATLALGLAERGDRLWWLVVPGFAAALLGARFPKASAALEVTVLAAGIALLTGPLLEWALVAALLIVAARALQIALTLKAA